MFLTASATALTTIASPGALATLTTPAALTATATPATAAPEWSAAVLPVLEVVALIALVLWRQLTPRRVKSDLVKLPLILGIVGVAQLWPHVAGGVNAGDAVAFAASLACGALISVPRARSLLLWQAQDGAWMRRGTPVTLAWWIASFAMHALVHVAPMLLGGSSGGFGSASMLLYIAVVLGVQGLCLERRLEALAPGTLRRARRAVAAK